MQDKDRFTIVGLGEILWDMLPAGKQLGGAPANFAYHAQALGARGAVASCIGQDDLGAEVLQQLRAVDLDTQFVAIDPDHATGTVSVKLDLDGKPDYIIHEQVAWDFIPFGPALEALAGRAHAVCFGSLCQRAPVSRETIQRFLAATDPACIRVFDINLRQAFYSPDIIRDMLELCQVLKLNDEELPTVATMLQMEGDEQDLLSQLQQCYDLQIIVLTKGAAGSVLLSADQVSYQHTEEKLEIADTVGAGDAFTAVVCVGLLQERDLDTINRAANKLSAFVCTQHGAMPSVPPSLVTDLWE
jgi:fructokinase